MSILKLITSKKIKVVAVILCYLIVIKLFGLLVALCIFALDIGAVYLYKLRCRRRYNQVNAVTVLPSNGQVADDLRLINVCLLTHLPEGLNQEADYCASVLSYPASHFNPIPISNYLKNKYIGMYTGNGENRLSIQHFRRAEKGSYLDSITVARTIIFNTSSVYSEEMG